MNRDLNKESNKDYSIGVFDSGVGGITVLREIIKYLPKENLIYMGDNKNAPYGEKTHEEILSYCEKIIDFLIEKKCKAVVIACNTATATAFEPLLKEYSIPIIGVIEPGARAAVQRDKKGKIAVLATAYTCRTKAYNREIAKISNEVDVWNISCRELCPMIESGWEEQENREEILEGYIKEIPKDSDTVILGCTHYPIIRDEIEKLISGKTLIDPAEETALELKKVLEEKALLKDGVEQGELSFFVTGESRNFKETVEKFLDMKISDVEKVEL